MAQSRKLTLIEVIALLFLLVVGGFIVLLPSHCGGREVASRTSCAANLSGIYKSMYTYSVSNEDKFPIWGAATPETDLYATGFQERDRLNDNYTPETSGLRHSVTASLWITVKDGSAGVKNFICPSSGDMPDHLLAAADGAPALLENTFDFLASDNLSYSTLNMYGSEQKKKWGSNVAADYVIMGDDNNADTPSFGRHQLHRNTKADQLSSKSLAKLENSQNHANGEGQNFMFGDSHVSFHSDPFQGRSGDNVYAIDLAEDEMAAEVAAPTPFRPGSKLDAAGQTR